MTIWMRVSASTVMLCIISASMWKTTMRVTKAMEERGIAKYMEGKSLVDPTATFTYYDSVEALGFIIEAVTKSKE